MIRNWTNCSATSSTGAGSSGEIRIAAGSSAGAAARQFARLRFHHRRDRHRGHQQPRHRRRRRDHRHPQRRHPHQGGADRQGSEDRSRAAADQDREAAEGGEVRRFRQAAAGRMGGGDRQPVQPRRHGDRRYRLGAQPRHQFRSLRQLHPDRRRHQSRQFGRTVVQSRWRSHRHQHRDHLSFRRLDRHRLCGAVEDGAGGDRPAEGVRRDPARLARRAHPAGDRRDRRKPLASSRRAARWSPASTRRVRPSPPASSPAT